MLGISVLESIFLMQIECRDMTLVISILTNVLPLHTNS